MTSTAPSRTAAVVVALRAAGLDVDDSTRTRALYAHDASNYRVEPRAVVFPHDAAAVATAVRTCHAHGVPVTVRGAGTGMAGNSIGSGIVLDLRRHLHHIGPIASDGTTVTVQPGAVLDDLQRALAPHDRMFGPDPSSHSRATIGGMLGNDACGNHSVAYGRTSDHVLALDLVLADGTRAVATRDGLRALDSTDAARVQALETRLRHIADTMVAPVRTAFDRSPRQVSGYAAHRLLAGDVARLLVGSEGSLAIIVGATLATVPRPTHTELVVIGYDDLVTAARDVPALIALHPAAIEALDRDLVRTLQARRGTAPTMPAGAAWLLVELADTVAPTTAASVIAAVQHRGRCTAVTHVTDAALRRALWQVREDGAGLASNPVDGPRGRPGWEDAAVPPHRLAEYLERLRPLAARHGYTGVLYGHFGAGCVHVRYDFDTTHDDGRRRMHAFLTEAAALVASCDGSVSGEHGDGRARGEFLAAMYPPEALAAFRAIKDALDPTAILNPGVIVDAPSAIADLPTPVRDQRTVLRLPSDGDSLRQAADRCVGVGRCVASGISAMCPTHQVTGREEDGTRGRARALQDLFLEPALPLADAVATLDTCLACKACATDCPTGVDMATYKAEVLHRFHHGRLRPRTHYTLGWLPRLTAAAAPVAGLVNALLRADPPRRALQRLAGITTVRTLPAIASTRRIRRLRRHDAQPQAVLFIDSTTRALAPEVAEAALRVFAAAGVRVETLTQGCCGLTYLSTGQLERARTAQRRLLRLLDRAPATIPVVVLEPSCAATLADELPRLLDEPRARALASRVRTFVEALTELAPEWPWPALPDALVLQEHCHERASVTPHQATVLRARGVTVAEAVGCCGMAGAFGYEPAHVDLSVQVALRSLAPTIDAHPTAPVLADGFGCRCQVTHVRPGTRPRHLAELLAAAI